MTDRDVNKAALSAVSKSSWSKGRRITVSASAGPRLAGKQGVIVGKGTTRSQIRVLLDGSKNFITLHERFVDQSNMN